MKVTDAAKGKWKGILSRLGFDARILNGKEHRCPAGHDSVFRFSDKNGRGNFFCSCNPDGRGDGFNLIMCCRGGDFKAAAALVEPIVSNMSEDPEKKRMSPELLRRIYREIIESSKREPCDQVYRYLSGRGITVRPRRLRACKTGYGLQAINQFGLFDAMVCGLYVGSSLRALHLTYLEDGRKASHSRARVMTTPLGEIAGASVPLQQPTADGVLGVGEGIETSLSGGQLFNVPVHACLNANLLERFNPPPEVRRLVIFGDNDESYTGHAAAYALAKRMRCKPPGKRIPVDVLIPRDVGKDWNDVLIENEKKHGH